MNCRRPRHPAGEDPVLTSEYVKHFSQGLQYGDPRTTPQDLERLWAPALIGAFSLLPLNVPDPFCKTSQTVFKT